MTPSWCDAANDVDRLLFEQAIEPLAAENAQRFIGAATGYIADCDIVSVNPYMNSVCFDWSRDSLQIEVHAHGYEVYHLTAAPVGIQQFTHKPDEQISNSMMGLLPKR